MKNLILRRRESLERLQAAKQEAAVTKGLIDCYVDEKSEQAIIDALRSHRPQDQLKLDLNAIRWRSNNNELAILASQQQDLNGKLADLLDKIDNGRISIFRKLNRECLLQPCFISGHKTVSKAAILREFTK